MFFHATKALLIIAISFLLLACAGPVPKIDLAPSATANIKTIAVIRPPEPKTYSVLNFGHGGAAFGLVGGIVAAVDQSAKQDMLSKAYQDRNVAICSELSQRVADRLNKLGFSVKVEDAQWEEVDGKRVLPFKKINSDADAVIALSPSVVGFVATGLAGGYNNDYLPTISVVVSLLGKDRETPIYRGFHVTGWQLKAEGWQFTPPTKTFSNFDSLISDPALSANALLDAADKIADSIAADLKRQQGGAKIAAAAAAVSGEQPK